MNSYLVLKLVHIISAVVLAGTGTGIAFFMFMANRSGNIQAIAVTTRHVVLADWIFTAPAVVIQLVTGIWLMKILGYSYSAPWFTAALGLYLFIGACWVPVVFIQYQLRALAAAQLTGVAAQERFKRLMQLWTVLGVMAFSAILVIFWLMVFKPLPLV